MSLSVDDVRGMFYACVIVIGLPIVVVLWLVLKSGRR